MTAAYPVLVTGRLGCLYAWLDLNQFVIRVDYYDESAAAAALAIGVRASGE